MPNDLLSLPATRQAELVRSGEASSRELVEASLAAIERLNGDLNAFVLVCGERALAEADAVEAGDERPLAGVPIALKDLDVLTEGLRTTFGSNAMGDWMPPIDSAIVRRLKGAGAIVVGKTNTPEFGLLPVTEPERFGAARNPWDPTRTPGGSSGGSGAAVGAEMVALAHGADGGGSLRIPASCCGLVGHKPSRARVSPWPLPEVGAELVVNGALTRTVADTALALDVLSGYEPGDPYLAPPPATTFADAAKRDPGSLRIGFTTEAPNGVPVAASCVEATHAAAELLESLGHRVEEAEPAGKDDAFVHAFTTVWTAGVGATVRGCGQLRGEDLDANLLEPMTREMVEASAAIDAVEYQLAISLIRTMSRAVMAFWSDHDVLLTPTLALEPLEIGALEAKEGEPAIQRFANAAGFTPFAPPWNATGQPAISLPLHTSDSGLPIGVQLVGPPGGDELLLSLAGQLEAARPWAERRPALATGAAA